MSLEKFSNSLLESRNTSLLNENLIEFHPRRPELSLDEFRLNKIINESLVYQESKSDFSSLYLINTRLWINELRQKYSNENLTLVDIPKSEWTALFDKYDSFWFMGIYQPSEASRQHCKKWPSSVAYAKENIDPENDIVASPFAIPSYLPNKNIAKDWSEWDIVLDYLHQNNKKVVLDFVPNHVALDHPWVKLHPEYFIQGNDFQKSQSPDLYYTVVLDNGQKYHLAHGKDPNYPEWADTLQLNYANPELQNSMREVILGENGLINHCDGLRCDMAMLLNPYTFFRTWGHKDSGGHLSTQEIEYFKNNEFWPKIIKEAKDRSYQNKKEDFVFIAEAYWDFDKLGQDFDVLYEKNFYDNLNHLSHQDTLISPEDIRNHINYLISGRKLGYRPYKLALFTENHDEDRAVTKFGKEASIAAATLTAFIPDNVFLINQGQENGYKIRPPMQLDKPIQLNSSDSKINNFYNNLLRIKNSSFVKEGIISLMPSSFMEDPYIISQKIVSKKGDLKAYVCTNFSNHTAYGHISELNSNNCVKILSITENVEIKNIDKDRIGGLLLKLNPWESQIIYYL